jgi:hypothetical protein
MGQALYHWKMNPIEFEELWNSGVFNAFHLTSVQQAAQDETDAIKNMKIDTQLPTSLQERMRQLFNER